MGVTRYHAFVINSRNAMKHRLRRTLVLQMLWASARFKGLKSKV